MTAALLERPVSFDYGYQMRCSTCRGLTALTSATYESEPNGAHVACDCCGSDIHFGPAVLGLRDDNDPVLCDLRVADFTWYHTSTDPGWPRHEPQAVSDTTTDLLLRTLITSGEIESAHRRLTTQALHVGTYEAAVESMLRRMRDQGDGSSQFYLYRVRLHSGLTLEAGWRDENHAEAAQITQLDLQGAGLDGIRYLNVHESPGSISLALLRRAVAAVQVMAIPPSDLRVDPPACLLARILDVRARIDGLGANRRPELDPLEQIRQRAAERRGEPFVRGLTAEQHELEQQVVQTLVDGYLTGVSLPVRSRFIEALPSWSGAQVPDTDDAAFVGRFASMAALLTRSEQVVALLRDSPWRPIPCRT